MKQYLITGGTGMVGSQLIDAIVESDAHITVLTRQNKINSHPKISYVNWTESDWESKVPDIDIVINLAGASLNHRWTKQHKQQIMLSRIQATQTLYELFKSRTKRPDVFFNASAVGYYRPDYNRTYTELYKSLPFDFLSEVVYQWERRAKQFETLGSRVVIGRFGMVLSDKGGALPLMKQSYDYYVGGKLGSGRQWYSWIHIDDLVRAILYTINDENAKGAFNFTAPIVERQNLFGYTLARITHRPHYTWVPSLALRLVLGQMSTVVLDTQKVIPNKLQALDFKFKYPDLKIALEDLVH
ncbi:TIGR01777 family oxidoreductase [Staphylococcus gallinarum]|uniref:TIGR01777 family oxidoreductase n=1 Tax=Staphylococcus gallinarum TaxID=1293 RepID=UPI000D1E96B1|nr:TIGR01777 family oxidoreductase [Staphylococcus gallinarum]MBU7218060.1 TIGR01777 family oxidoreductase [Staphylococcus gallinarum]MCD8786501.1 TIGR01777 family oxidoreductase [Staphylococcus gallinarum]MCD8794575.1 TIGR01777 family oxidoreductase [Staphylococcus gallinarum]MCD8828768.1 TIGR01777 family oxidoreductase [Staphylococcus gallinarum]MCD8843637.1 TIGR01777 family oxidoreductase [Staphylococcus gallinarum]